MKLTAKKKPSASLVVFKDGIAVHGDCLSKTTLDAIRTYLGGRQVPLILTDPPYGNIINVKWDLSDNLDAFVSWMVEWTLAYEPFLLPQAAMYVWGAVGRHRFRPFFKYIMEIEDGDALALASLITWKKKRAYGVQHNYLYTREELAYFCKGDVLKPRIFHVPLLDEKRGYAGFNKDYPAKSEYFRRTNVWTDINEMFRGKVHPTQKPVALMKVPIQVHTNEGDTVIDMFGGSGSTAIAARELGRKFVVVEKDAEHFKTLVGRLT